MPLRNTDIDYSNRDTYILLGNHVLIIENYQINSKLVWDFHQSLMKLAEHKTQVPGY
jgi:hypothetical protein